MAQLPNIEAYPKTVMLRDRARVVLRPLAVGDRERLLYFFQRVPEQERYYLKEDVTAPEVVRAWTTDIDFERVIPIVALVEDEIVGDATLHRSRALAQRHVAEFRVVVDPAYRGIGLGRRLLLELLDIATELGLEKATFELVAQHEEAAIMAATSVGFREVAVLKDRIRDMWGEYQDLVLMELPLEEHQLWSRF